MLQKHRIYFSKRKSVTQRCLMGNFTHFTNDTPYTSIALYIARSNLLFLFFCCCCCARHNGSDGEADDDDEAVTVAAVVTIPAV